MCENSISMIICGDTVPTEPNYEEFCRGEREALISEAVWDKMKDADFRFYNLEVPLCDEKRPIVKCGPNLIAPSDCINGIKTFFPSLIGLANNHTLDQDVTGLRNTFNILRDNGIHFIGAGENLSEAEKPFIFEKNGIKVGIYNCAEHEFTIAEENYPGANPFDVFESPKHIRKLKDECDYVVVIYHGCKEHYRYPSPMVRKACRHMVDSGADLVIGQHSHAVGCEEKYNGGLIVYGQGNFVFDHLDNEYWKTGLVIKATFGKEMSVEYIPLCRENKGVGLGDTSVLDGFFKRSEEIKKPGFVEAKYKEYALSMMDEYFVMLSMDNGKPFSATAERAGEKELHKNYHQSVLAAMENLFRCEAHNELIRTALHELSGSGKYYE